MVIFPVAVFATKNVASQGLKSTSFILRTPCSNTWAMWVGYQREMFTWQEAWHIHKCNQWNIEGITKPHKSCSFHWCIDVQTTWNNSILLNNSSMHRWPPAEYPNLIYLHTQEQTSCEKNLMFHSFMVYAEKICQILSVARRTDTRTDQPQT